MESPSVICYVSPHKPKSAQICSAFAKGCGGRVESGKTLLSGAAMFYGITSHTLEIFAQAKQSAQTIYYADNGYLHRGEYFRVTHGNWQHSGVGRADYQRLAQLGIEISSAKIDGDYVLICPPGQLYARLMGFDAEHWLQNIMEQLRRITRRDLHIRVKPDARSLKENYGILPKALPDRSLHDDLAGAWALVTHNSNVAVDAALAGVPVFVTGQSPALAIGSGRLEDIENPPRPDVKKRLEWAAVLAANQWSMEEMENGICWRMLNANA